MTHKWIATALLTGNTPFADRIVKKSSRAQSQEVHSVLTCGSHEKSEHAQHSAIFPNTHPRIKRGALQQQLKRTSRVIPEPPAKITSSRFGSDVAARAIRAVLRTEVLQVREVELKMSTVL